MTTPTGPAGFILRLLAADSGTAGVGVLVSQSEVLSCAHVVNATLGRPLDSQDKPGHRDVFEVCFPLLEDRYPQRFRARVADWLPPHTRGGPGGDLTRVLLLDLIPEVKAAVRDRDLPPRGRLVRIFGYPSTPNRPEGGWVEAKVVDLVGRQAMQLEALPGSGGGIQPGFCGSPVVDRETGLVLGLLAMAPAGGSDADVSYAITIDQIGALWPSPVGPTSMGPGSVGPNRVRDRRFFGDVTVAEAAEANRVRSEGLVVLHVSDPHFGPNNPFDGSGGLSSHGDYDSIRADHEAPTLFTSLAEDLDKIGKSENLHPDLIVVTGGLTESGSAEEFAGAMGFLARLAAELDLPRRRVVIVPGEDDVDRQDVQEDAIGGERLGQRSRPPAWKGYAAAFDRFYRGAEGAVFDGVAPWTLFEIPDLRVVVAGLNSNMAANDWEEDHGGQDRGGQVGEAQLQWFTDQLSRRDYESWIRIGAVHHSMLGDATCGEHGTRKDIGDKRGSDSSKGGNGSGKGGEGGNIRNLRDAEALDQSLGGRKLLHLLFSGHANDGRPHRLPSGLITLSAGRTPMSEGAGPPNVVHRYQILLLKRGEILRYARRYLRAEGRWVGDVEASPDGFDWRCSIDWTFPDIAKVFPHPGLDVSGDERGTGARAHAHDRHAHHEWSTRT